MPRWLVTQGDRQFAAENLAQLKELARRGEIGPGDMIQPPGAADWLYAAEVPELQGLLPEAGATHQADTDDDIAFRRKGIGAGVLVPLLLLVVVGGALAMWYYTKHVFEADYDILGKDGLALTEMLVTEVDAPVRKEPADGAPKVAEVDKDSKVQLLAKRGGWYEVELPDGTRGWMAVDDVVPAYFFADAKTREDYDPIYNPDRYIFVKNSDWKQLPNDRNENVTVFQFLLQNKSKFEMTDLVLKATIKDKDDHVLETREFSIEGSVPPYANAWVGTLNPPEDQPDAPARAMTDTLFKQLAEKDPDLQLRWADGIEVQMQSEGFVEANIDIVQVRAVPKKL